MNNNLKAERTLTAENGWRAIDSVPMDGTTVDLWCRRSWMPPVTHERSVDMYWCTVHECWRKRGNEHFVDYFWTPSKAPNSRHLIPELWRPLGLPGQSLSTQQPMGEVVGYISEKNLAYLRSGDVNGAASIEPVSMRAANIPLYALHPNQESGE